MPCPMGELSLALSIWRRNSRLGGYVLCLFGAVTVTRAVTVSSRRLISETYIYSLGQVYNFYRLTD